MEIQRVIIRRPVNAGDKFKGLTILMTVDMSKFPRTIEEVKALPFERQKEVVRMATDIDRAARLLGFLSVKDMTDFIDMYGPDALL